MKTASIFALLLFLASSKAWSATSTATNTTICKLDSHGLCIKETGTVTSTGTSTSTSTSTSAGTGECAPYSGIRLDFCHDAQTACSGRPDNMPRAQCIKLYVDTGVPPPLGGSGGASAPNTNRANGWIGVKSNNSMFDPQSSEHIQLGGVNGVFIDQADSLASHADMMMACAGVNIQGRTDQICATNPDDPECTGMNSALGNASTCAVYAPPNPDGTRDCLVYGAHGFSSEEWLVFGQQYFNGMTGCMILKEGVEKTDDRKLKMNGLNDLVTIGAGPSPQGGHSPTANSQITGIRPEEDLKSGLAEKLAAKFDDGAAHLGYAPGDLIRKAAQGISFLTAFSESPFASKIPPNTKQSIEVALGSPDETMEKVSEKRLALKEGSKDTEEVAARTPASVTGAKAIQTATLPANSETPARVEKTSSLSMGDAAPTQISFSRSGKTKEMAAARALLGEPVSGNTKEVPLKERPIPVADTPVAVAALENAAEASLFQRVNHMYRRRENQFRYNPESKTARDVRDTETPEFFKSL